MSRLKKLQNVFDYIDENYGCGPSEEIIDETKVDEYIHNFITEFKEYKIFEELSVLTEGALNEGITKTPVEMLYEI